MQIVLLCICGEKFILMFFLLYMVPIIFFKAENSGLQVSLGVKNLFWGKLDYNI